MMRLLPLKKLIVLYGISIDPSSIEVPIPAGKVPGDSCLKNPSAIDTISVKDEPDINGRLFRRGQSSVSDQITGSKDVEIIYLARYFYNQGSSVCIETTLLKCYNIINI